MEFRRRVKLRCKSGSMLNEIQQGISYFLSKRSAWAPPDDLVVESVYGLWRKSLLVEVLKK
jgi:hypothetical protein